MKERRRTARSGLAGLVLVGTSVAGHAQVITVPPYQVEGGKAETVSITATGSPGSRRFDLSTSFPQRDDGPQRRTVTEGSHGRPYIATGDTKSDALFAVAVDDARLDAVTTIKDSSYNNGNPISCNCFETGEQWHYLWTRDLSYALDLGLAGFDPKRAVESLLFKTSAIRKGVPVPAELGDGSRQIVQDTGSGGSWPISTDRTSWALGAERTLANLTGIDHDTFAQRALDALRGTLEADRLAAFDPRDGLYGGEHSFLDWREQTYAPWIVENLSAMAAMKGLSTNIVHFRAMTLAATLARQQGQAALAQRYDGWAEALKTAIARAFWDEKAGLYATYVSADANPFQIAKYDLLGNDLAIISGIADAARARRILSQYPFAPYGPPVVWPQAPGEFVYHNRAQWPFVTAYTLRAAAQSGHVAAADRSLDALVRGATLHLSNMENLEWLTGKSKFDDGPAINSRRQLWSVAGYLGAVTNTIFGWQPGLAGVRVAPFLTSHARRLFGNVPTARLSRLRFAGRDVEIALTLPSQAADGAVYPVRSITLNGKPAPRVLTAGQLGAGTNHIVVTFGAPRRSMATVTEAPAVSTLSHDDARAFMPRTPTISVEETSELVRVVIKPSRQSAPVSYSVLRDGKIVGRAIPSLEWVDRGRDRNLTNCYSVVARFTASGIASQPSAPACVRGTAAQTITIDDPRLSGDARRLAAGDGVAVPTLQLGQGQKLTIRDIQVAQPGTYAVSFMYNNHIGPLNTGITNAVKRLTIADAGSSRQAVVQMPHIAPEGALHPVRSSTRAYLTLRPGSYRLELGDFINMSALQSNATYSAQGGRTGPVNEARIAEIRIDRID
jgi:hypothetical protein